MTEFTVAKTITVDCPECQGSHVIKVGQRNGYQRYQCQDCKTKFRHEGQAEGRKYDAELIGATIRDYYMGLSIKQLAESIADRYGIPEPSKGTIYGWISDYTDKATYALRDVKAHTSGHWVADEMYVKVGGITVYYWVVMDKGTRYILGSYLSTSRGEDAATEVLRKALAVADRPPNRITTDKWTAYPPAIRAVLPRTTKHIRANHITDFINNNLSERMNGTYRAREKTLRGMDSIESGQHLLDGFTITYNLFRDHHALKGRKPADAAKVDVPFKEWADLVRTDIEVPASHRRKVVKRGTAKVPPKYVERAIARAEAKEAKRKSKGRVRAPKAVLPEAGIGHADRQLPLLSSSVMRGLRPKPPRIVNRRK